MIQKKKVLEYITEKVIKNYRKTGNDQLRKRFWNNISEKVKKKVLEEIEKK